MATKTSSFGVSKREGHNSSAYYKRQMAQAVVESTDTAVNEVPDGVADRFYCHSSEKMVELPDNSVALMVTSPPYSSGKQYEGDLSYTAWCGLMYRVLLETYRVLQPGGRIAFNVANLGRKPYVPLTAAVYRILARIGYHIRGEIIWVKADGAGGNCAWGSWLSPKNPVLRDLHEYVIVASKGRFDRVVAQPEEHQSIPKEAFLRDTQSVWRVQPESAKRVGHPAPFPVELPRRLIELFTYAGEVVLDPFSGAGSTALAARRTGRRFVCYDTVDAYVKLSAERLAKDRTA